MQKEIAVRLYVNEKYGTTCGKGMYRRALFNGTADVYEPRIKYLLDFYTIDEWQHGAKTNDDMAAVNHAQSQQHADKAYSWVVRYDITSKAKTRVTGFCEYDMATNELTLLVLDTAKGVENTWQLDVKSCTQNALNKNAPHLLATNVADLSTW